MVRRWEVPLSVELKQESVQDRSVQLNPRWLEVLLHPGVRLTPWIFVFPTRTLSM